MKGKFVIFAITSFVLCFVLLIEACRKHDTFSGTTPHAFITPAGFPAPHYDFQRNPLNKETIELGRNLFYEGRLAKDNFNSCGSCHNQEASFTTYNHDLSHGYNQSHTRRNAPVLLNIAWQKEFQHDGSGKSIEEVILNHINSPIDMGGTMNEAISKIRIDTLYKRLFREAFGSETVSSQKILTALKQFTLQMVSANSKYDRVKNGIAFFTIQEQAGYQLFKTNCASCHTEPLFTDLSYRNIGLHVDNYLLDVGRMHVTNNRSDSLKFKVPTLRNVFASSYYTHDGRFPFVRNMINHYQSGVVQSHTLDPLLKNGIPLTSTEEDNIISFLRTLTDSSFLQNPHYDRP